MARNIDLQGRVGLVTGASRGLGRAAAVALAQAGADVALTALTDAQALNNVVREVEALGRRAVAFLADVSRAQEATRLVEEAYRQLGRLDVLVNNAGHSAPKSWGSDVHAIDVADLDRAYEVDVRGTFLISRAAHPHLVRTKGAIINLTSGAALEGDPSVLLYAAAKAGVHGLTKALAAAWAPNVRVNAIAPGSIRTGWIEGWNVPREDLAKIEARTPMRRLGEPDDVANAVLFLASDLSGFVTGQTIVVDGGVWRT